MSMYINRDLFKLPEWPKNWPVFGVKVVAWTSLVNKTPAYFYLLIICNLEFQSNWRQWFIVIRTNKNMQCLCIFIGTFSNFQNYPKTQTKVGGVVHFRQYKSNNTFIRKGFYLFPRFCITDDFLYWLYYL